MRVYASFKCYSSDQSKKTSLVLPTRRHGVRLTSPVSQKHTHTLTILTAFSTQHNEISAELCHTDFKKDTAKD